MKRTTFILSFLFPVLLTTEDWPGYRVPIGMGVIQAKAKPPLHWDAKTGGNILWQVPLPLGDGTVEHVATVQEPWPESTALMVEKASKVPIKVGGKEVPEHEAYVMGITLKNADRRVFFVNYSKGSKEIGKVTTNAEVATWNLGESERG